MGHEILSNRLENGSVGRMGVLGHGLNDGVDLCLFLEEVDRAKGFNISYVGSGVHKLSQSVDDLSPPQTKKQSSALKASCEKEDEGPSTLSTSLFERGTSFCSLSLSHLPILPRLPRSSPLLPHSPISMRSPTSPHLSWSSMDRIDGGEALGGFSKIAKVYSSPIPVVADSNVVGVSFEGPFSFWAKREGDGSHLSPSNYSGARIEAGEASSVEDLLSTSETKEHSPL